MECCVWQDLHSTPLPRASMSLFCTAVCLLLLSCAKAETWRLRPETLQSIETLHSGFHSAVVKRVPDKPTDAVYSSTSLWFALSMLHQGARGKSKAVLEKPLSTSRLREQAIRGAELSSALESLNGGPNELGLANGVFLAKDIEVKPKFLGSLSNSFKAEIKRVAFPQPGQSEVNEWAESKTNGKIKDLVKGLSADTRLVLVNAIYFKGLWATQFEKKDTKTSPFLRADTHVRQVPMMSQTLRPESNATIAESDRYQVLSLPYKGSDLSSGLELRMHFILEKVSDDDKMESMIPSARKIDFDEALKLGATQYSKIDVFLPRFKVEYQPELKEILMDDLGLASLFGRGANLLGISNERLFVSDAVQKAFIEVNEEGSEAAAATAITGMMFSLPPPQYKFNANRPFGFVIALHQHGKPVVQLFTGFYESGN